MPEPANDQSGAPNSNAIASFVESRRANAMKSLGSLAGKTETPAPAPSPPQVETPIGEPAEVVEPPATEFAPAEVAEPKLDPEEDPAAKAMAKQEIYLKRRMAEQHQKSLDAIAAREAEVEAKLAEVRKFEAARTKLREDLPGFLVENGFTPADLEHSSQLLWAHSPEGSKDPRNKEIALKTKAEREQAALIDELRKRLDDKDQREREREERQQAQSRAEQYIAGVTKAVTDSTPLTKQALANAPDETRFELFQIALRLREESGPTEDLREDPTNAEVIRAYEAQALSNLKRFGVDPKAFGKPAAPAAAPAAQQKPPTTLSPSAPAPTEPMRPGRKSRDELITFLRQQAKQARS